MFNNLRKEINKFNSDLIKENNKPLLDNNLLKSTFGNLYQVKHESEKQNWAKHKNDFNKFDDIDQEMRKLMK